MADSRSHEATAVTFRENAGHLPLGGQPARKRNDTITRQRESAMGLRKLRVYTGPETESPSLSLLDAAGDPNTVRVSLGEILPTLADAVASDRTWLSDFADDEMTISSDLYDVLQAYRHFRRPGV
jgi:hypothetical protein